MMTADQSNARSVPGWAVARTNHGRLFVAALRRGNVLLCQFHPELSGSFGSSLLARWLGGESVPQPPRMTIVSRGEALLIAHWIAVSRLATNWGQEASTIPSMTL